jgi:hypothetical protein
MIKLLEIASQIISEEDWATKQEKEFDIAEPFEVGERGYLFIKDALEKLNKKANRYGVEPMTLKVIKEVEKKFKFGYGIMGHKWQSEVPMNSSDILDVSKGESGFYVKKFYTLQIEGKPPHVEGYEFIAKIEHTTAGNILNFNPYASAKNLPTEYRTATQKCDVCNTNRDRNNTFILKLTKEDLQRFPDKKVNDLIMAGSACLKRFLPPKDMMILVNYAKFIDEIRRLMAEDAGDDEGGEGGYGSSYSQYTTPSNTLFWIAVVYLVDGKYLSKKKALEFEGAISTLHLALSAKDFMERPPQDSRAKDKYVERIYNDKTFLDKAEQMAKDIVAWGKTKDFASEEQKNPQFADFYHNLSVIAKSDTVKKRNNGFIAALFQMYIMEKTSGEKKAAQSKATEEFGYLGKIGDKIKMTVEVKKMKEYTTQFSYRGTQALIVNMIGETNEAGIQKKGFVLYFTNMNFTLVEGDKAEIETTIKNHQINKYTNRPETVITRAKVLQKLS